MTLLHEALEPVKEFFKENPTGMYKVSDKRTTGLRLDWEEADDSGFTNEQRWDDMFAVVEKDVAELIEDGDVNIVSDPLLKSMNGSKVRGQEPTKIEIAGAQAHSEYKAAKCATEWTVYMVLYVEWPDGKSGIW